LVFFIFKIKSGLSREEARKQLRNFNDIQFSHDLFNNEYDINEIYADDNILNNMYDKIREKCKENKSACVLIFAEWYRPSDTSLFHAISLIFYYDDSNKLICGIYDPMYHERENTNYVWAANAVYLRLKYDLKDEITIYNLSQKFCHVSKKGLHCIQYTINAEYCSMFSLYFFYLYAKHGFPKNLDAIDTVVKETFISNPTNVSRTSCKATNKFKLVIMSFILTVMTIISDKSQTLQHVYDINTDMINKNEYYLLHPSIFELLNKKLKLNNAPSPEKNNFRRNGKNNENTRRVSKKSNNNVKLTRKVSTNRNSL
jgi:hypothetical protein